MPVLSRVTAACNRAADSWPASGRGRSRCSTPTGACRARGELHRRTREGIVSAYPGTAPGAEPLRSCCVPPGAAAPRPVFTRRETSSRRSSTTRTERPILADGRPWPPRPAGVPDDAEYDEANTRWARRRPELHRFWTDAGVLTSEIEYPNGVRRATRTFDAAGRLAEACELSPDGRPSRRVLFGASRSTPRASTPTRASERSGARFDQGQAVGTWSFLDGGGHRAEDGGARSGVRRGRRDGLASILARPLARAPADWWALSGALRAEGRVREALCAAARAAVRQGDRAALERALAADVVRARPGARRGNAGRRSNSRST